MYDVFVGNINRRTEKIVWHLRKVDVREQFERG
jgi:hypothetical protein